MEDVVFLNIDVIECEAIISEYKITTMPCILFIKLKNKVASLNVKNLDKDMLEKNEELTSSINNLQKELGNFNHDLSITEIKYTDLEQATQGRGVTSEFKEVLKAQKERYEANHKKIFDVQTEYYKAKLQEFAKLSERQIDKKNEEVKKINDEKRTLTAKCKTYKDKIADLVEKLGENENLNNEDVDVLHCKFDSLVVEMDDSAVTKMSQDKELLTSSLPEMMFQSINNNYNLDRDLVVHYRTLNTGFGDRVGLYRLPKTKPHEYVAFVWARNGEEGVVIFDSSVLPREEGEFLVMYLQGDNKVVGISVPFQMEFGKDIKQKILDYVKEDTVSGDDNFNKSPVHVTDEKGIVFQLEKDLAATPEVERLTTMLFSSQFLCGQYVEKIEILTREKEDFAIVLEKEVKEKSKLQDKVEDCIGEVKDANREQNMAVEELRAVIKEKDKMWQELVLLKLETGKAREAGTVLNGENSNLTIKDEDDALQITLSVQGQTCLTNKKEDLVAQIKVAQDIQQEIITHPLFKEKLANNAEDAYTSSYNVKAEQIVEMKKHEAASCVAAGVGDDGDKRDSLTMFAGTTTKSKRVKANTEDKKLPVWARVLGVLY